MVTKLRAVLVLASCLTVQGCGVLYVAQEKHWPSLERAIKALGYHDVLLGEPYRHRIFFTIAGP